MRNSLTPSKSETQSLPPNLQKCLSKFEKHLKLQKKRSPETVRSYLSQATNLLEFLLSHEEQLPLDQVTPSDLLTQPELLREHLREASKILHANSQAQKVSALKCFLNFLIDENLCELEILRSIERPKTQRKLITIVSEESLRFLYKEIRRHRPLQEQLLFELLYGSGLRISEAAQLDWSHVAGTQLEKTGLEILGKGKKRRIVPLTSRAEGLFKLVKNNSSTELIFPHTTRTLRRWVENWAYLVPEAELKLHPHLLRHSLASHLLRRGAHLAEIQRLLGHSKLSTTERYTHLNMDDLIKIYDKSFASNLVSKSKQNSNT